MSDLEKNSNFSKNTALINPSELNNITYDLNGSFPLEKSGENLNEISISKSVLVKMEKKSLNNYTKDLIDLDINEAEEFEYDRLKYTIPKRIDNLPYSRFHTIIIISLGISWVLDGYEVSLLSVLSGVLESNFSVKEQQIGLAGSLYLLGCVIGSLLFGFLASIYGRRTLFNITLIIYACSIISTSLALDINMFFVCRFFTGVAVGGEYSSIFAAIDELIPPSIRGRADLIIDGTWHFGSFLASIISFCVMNIFKDKKEYEGFLMRILFSLGAFAILPVIYMRKFIPESPRWLIYKGKYQEALRICEMIEAKCSNNQNNEFNSENCLNITQKETIKENTEKVDERFENDENYKFLQKENSSLLTASNLKACQIKKNKIHKRHTYKDIFVFLFRIHKSRFFYALILMASQAFFYNGIFYTYTLILQNFYSIEKKIVGLFLIPLSVASFMGPLLLGKYFDSWSRRKMIALTFITSGILLVLTATNFLFEFFGFFVQQIFWFFTFLVASPAASSAHLTISEIFPIEMRSQAMAIFFSMGLGIGGVISPFLYGVLVSNNNKESIFYSYLFAAFVMIFAGCFGFFYGIDAENKSLETIANLGKEIERQDINKH